MLFSSRFLVLNLSTKLIPSMLFLTLSMLSEVLPLLLLIPVLTLMLVDYSKMLVLLITALLNLELPVSLVTGMVLPILTTRLTLVDLKFL